MKSLDGLKSPWQHLKSNSPWYHGLLGLHLKKILQQIWQPGIRTPLVSTFILCLLYTNTILNLGSIPLQSMVPVLGPEGFTNLTNEVLL